MTRGCTRVRLSSRTDRPPADVEPTVEVFHEEANELKRILDGLEEMIEEGV